jgi:hypothetical protein
MSEEVIVLARLWDIDPVQYFWHQIDWFIHCNCMEDGQVCGNGCREYSTLTQSVQED